jgi:lipocalin
MFEQGVSVDFRVDDYFKGLWYHIATNTREDTSLWQKIQGHTVTCHNVIIGYQKTQDGKIAYENACYNKGVYNAKNTRRGIIVPDQSKPGFYTMMDSAAGNSITMSVLATDYDHYAIVINDQKMFWLLSRKPVICQTTLLKAKEKLSTSGFNLSNVTIDYNVIQDCTDSD